MRNTIRFANWLNKLSSWNQILTVSVATCLFVAIVVYFLGIKKRRISSFATKHSKFLIQKLRREHHSQHQLHPNQQHLWHYHDLFVRPIFCNICELVVVSNGINCSFCNVYVHENCLRRAERHLKCKTICQLDEIRAATDSTSATTIVENVGENEQRTRGTAAIAISKCWSHHWIKGNLPLNSICFLCCQPACIEPRLADYKCVWCWKYVHEECLNSISSQSLVSECTFGTLSNLLLKPNYVIQTKSIRNNYDEYIYINNVKIIDSYFRTELDANYDTARSRWVIKEFILYKIKIHIQLIQINDVLLRRLCLCSLTRRVATMMPIK